MPEPSEKELNESIEALTSYRDRLRKELKSISQKLRMSPKNIDIVLDEHSELKNVEKTIEQLIHQKKSNQ